GLNRPVQEYVPEVAGAGKEAVMVHHLLTHTSGFDDAAIATYLQGEMQGGKLPRVDLPMPPLIGHYFDAAHAAPLARAPGVDMSYSGYGYGLLAEIVRRVAGRPLAEVAQARVFDPLGMANAGYAVPEDKRCRHVQHPPGAPFHPHLNAPRRP